MWLDNVTIEQIGIGIASLCGSIYMIYKKVLSEKINIATDQAQIDVITILRQQCEDSSKIISEKENMLKDRDAELQKLRSDLDSALKEVENMKRDNINLRNRIVLLNDLIQRLTKVIDITNNKMKDNENNE